MELHGYLSIKILLEENFELRYSALSAAELKQFFLDILIQKKKMFQKLLFGSSTDVNTIGSDKQ